MPGGPRRLEGRDYEPSPRVVAPLVLSEEERRWDEAMRVWRRARMFQRRARAVTRAQGMSLTAWEVLELTERLVREKDEPVSQLEVAARAGRSKGTISELMRCLTLAGLVDIGPDCWGITDRILVTGKGRAMVVWLRGALLEAARLLGTDDVR